MTPLNKHIFVQKCSSMKFNMFSCHMPSSWQYPAWYCLCFLTLYLQCQTLTLSYSFIKIRYNKKIKCIKFQIWILIPCALSLKNYILLFVNRKFLIVVYSMPEHALTLFWIIFQYRLFIWTNLLWVLFSFVCFNTSTYGCYSYPQKNAFKNSISVAWMENWFRS